MSGGACGAAQPARDSKARVCRVYVQEFADSFLQWRRCHPSAARAGALGDAMPPPMHVRPSIDDPPTAARDAASADALDVVLLRAASCPAPLRRALETAPDVRLVVPEEAGGGERRADVVVLDVDARDPLAERAVREASARWRPAPLLVSTASEDRACNRRLVRAGARGVVTHARGEDHLLTAIRRVRDGEIWLARACMSRLIDELARGDPSPPPHLASAEGLEKLTEREREVVALIARGLHNKAIAAELRITDHTVRHHLTAIFAKLGVADRLELAVYAFRHRAAGGGGPAG